MTGYDFAGHMESIARWYGMILAEHHPDGHDRQAKMNILQMRDILTGHAARPDAPVETIAASVQWNVAVLELAESERASGRPGWREEWDGVWDYYQMNDMVLGPYGPGGP